METDPEYLFETHKDMVEGTMRARKYRYFAEDWKKDMKQEGYTALWSCCLKQNTKRPFKDYAQSAIDQSITRLCLRLSSPFFIPSDSLKSSVLREQKELIAVGLDRVSTDRSV